jgi:hypothetical protein
MGLGAMTSAMLRLPMTAVLVTSLFLGSDGFPVIPLTIVAAVVAYVAENWLTPATAASSQAPGDDGGKRAPDLPPPRAGETPVDVSSPPGRHAQGLS